MALITLLRREPRGTAFNRLATRRLTTTGSMKRFTVHPAAPFLIFPLHPLWLACLGRFRWGEVFGPVSSIWLEWICRIGVLLSNSGGPVNVFPSPLPAAGDMVVYEVGAGCGPLHHGALQGLGLPL